MDGITLTDMKKTGIPDYGSRINGTAQVLRGIPATLRQVGTGATILAAKAISSKSGHPSLNSTLTATHPTSKGTVNDPNWRDDPLLQHAAYKSAPVEGYSIDSELSTKEATVYKHNKTGKVTVAFSGTQTDFTHDFNRTVKHIMTDVAIAGGVERYTPEFQDALQVGKNTIAKYGKDNVHTTGHSMGGTKSDYISDVLDIPATTYNKGVGPLNILGSVGRGDKHSKVHDYYVPGDIVSSSAGLQPYGKQTMVKQPEKIKKLQKLFSNKPKEMAAGTTLTEAASTIPVIGGAVKAGLAGVGAYKVASAFNDLHKSDNFTQPKDLRPSAVPHSAVPHTQHPAPIRAEPKKVVGPVGVSGGKKTTTNAALITSSNHYDHVIAPSSLGATASFHNHGFSREHHSRPKHQKRRGKGHRHAH